MKKYLLIFLIVGSSMFAQFPGCWNAASALPAPQPDTCYEQYQKCLKTPWGSVCPIEPMCRSSYYACKNAEATQMQALYKKMQETKNPNIFQMSGLSMK